MRRSVFVVCLAAFFANVRAQEPTFTSSANLVVVDVSVKDKSGKVVPGLTKNDFELLEDGKPQQVSVFEFQRLDSDDIQRKPVPATKTAQAAPPPQPVTTPQRTSSGQFSGAPRPVIRFQDRRLVAMLFDFSAMAIPEQSRVQQSALEFLHKQLKPADLVCIMTTSTGPLKIVQDFTDDRDRLEEVIKGFQ
ncbi:MAG TPA: VWA domain-containing protein, partial [Bryobacteraceae bacterium]|nr:VWA domain-containing protein [Bryobacteraceae bacterium]